MVVAPINTLSLTGGLVWQPASSRGIMRALLRIRNRKYLTHMERRASRVAIEGAGTGRGPVSGRAGCDCIPNPASLADESAWKRRFDAKRDIIRRLAREALEESDP